MRSLSQPLTDYERMQIVSRQSERQSSQWAQSSVANEGGGFIVAPYKPQGFWAGITGVGKNDGSYTLGSAPPDNRMQYEWVALLRCESKDKNGNTILSWIPLDGKTKRPGGSAPFDDTFKSYKAASGTILCPAVETSNNQTVPIGSVVWMMPGGQLDFPTNEDFSGDTNLSIPPVNQEFLFSWGESIRPFVVTENHIPATMVYSTGSATKICPRFVTGYFADDTNQTPQKFYPASSPAEAQTQATWEKNNPNTPAPIGVASDPVPFGVVVCEGAYNYARGWAKWVSAAYEMPQEGTDPHTWKGQWQIVTMDDSVLLDGEVDASETTGIAPGAAGKVQLWWPQNTPVGPLVNSGYVVAVTNILEAKLTSGQKVKLYFDRDDYAWYPLLTPTDTGLREFELDADLIPKIVDGDKVDITEYQTIGHFLDDTESPTTTIDLFPKTTPVEAKALADENYAAAVHLWLGLGRVAYTAGALVHNGTRGFAKWVPQAYQKSATPGTPEAYLPGADDWVGQWQIAYLDAALIVHAKVSAYYSAGNTNVSHNSNGYANIWWNTGTSTAPTLTEADGNHEVLFFNSSLNPLYIGDSVLLQFNREEGVWYAIHENPEGYPFINQTSEGISGHDAPAYGVMGVTGISVTDGIGSVTVEKPSSTVRKEYAVNLGAEVAAAASGRCHCPGPEPILIAYDTGTPAVGEVWVPKAGQWTLTKGTEGAAWGVRVIGIYDATTKILLGRVVESSLDVAFELYDDVGPGDVTNAKQAWRLKNSSGSLVRDTDAVKIVVNDGVLGDVRAYGSNHSGFSTGAKGWASMEADGKYHVKSIQRLAKTIIVANTASGHAAVAAGTASFTATFTRVCDDGQPPTVSSPATLVVYNPGWEIDDAAANITCVMDTGTGVSNCLYRIIDAPCPA